MKPFSYLIVKVSPNRLKQEVVATEKTFGDAKNEAHNLAQNNPGLVFVIYAPLEKYQSSTPKVYSHKIDPVTNTLILDSTNINEL